MTTFVLIRHGSNDLMSHMLVGRNPGVHLNGEGKREAQELAEALAGLGIQQIFSSPMERCRETAEPLAKRAGLNIQVSPALNEVQFGDWTGRTFAELDGTESWKQWNAFRSDARVPNGESMLEVQARVVGLVGKLRREFRGQRLALFSHGDPLRSALIYYLGMPSELIRRIELSPASASVVAFTDWEAQVRCLNARFGKTPVLI